MNVTSKDGTTIAYDKSGQGPTVILVGGALNDRTFGVNPPLVPLLEPHFTVINYDRRGRGDSTDTLPYAVDREVEDLEALIDSVGEPVCLYGISSGGALVLEAAKKLDRKVKKVLIYEAPMIVDSSRAPLPPDYVTKMNELVAADNRAGVIKYFMTKGIGMSVFIVAMMRLMPGWPGMKARAHTLPYDTALTQQYQHGQPLDPKDWIDITTPTLVMAGSKSPKWMQNAMDALANALPNATHKTLKGQMHIVSAKAIAPVIIEFFK